FDHILYADSDSRPDEESSIVSAFNSEIDKVLDSDLIQRFINNSGVASDRLEAVNWMLKVHGFYHFRPETAYLSVNYLDHFLLSRTLQKGKGWHFQLLSVACLSLAAKMEEISVPLLLDLQMKEPKFLFKPKTIQRMELMVMTILKWRLRKTTPFDFLHYFVHKLSCFGLIHCQHYNHVISQSSDIIVLTCQVIEFLDYPPSAIAAAAVLCATDQYPGERIVVCFHQRVSREKVRKCYKLMKESICLLPQIKRPKLIQLLPSPVGVIGESCNVANIGVTGT
ncbi:cyclin-D1-1, partial [Morus notabilis]|uniref:cyclin-D1-1 n=1 Tax=Morus notabilis TaxID=981085 RepID=UPI000CECF7A7